ncbi:ANKRD50 [Mytilus edulis]|uniref:ANKRD50 n=1 Tax=Mytilus edulis TaxID=6550 RepID=A0A8S3QT05_MYTED|nr:ANKRD50 [Mytilus edulis]
MEKTREKSYSNPYSRSSGCGKSSNIHHIALHLRNKYGYEIIPVFTGPSDITNYYKTNKPQVFVVDDICGKEIISKLTLQIWRDYSENLEKLFANEKNKILNTNPSEISDPVDIIERNIHCIISESKLQFCAIVLCIVFDDGFRTDWLKLTSAPETKRAKLEYIVNEFDIDLTKEMSRNYLKDCFRTLNGTYLKQKAAAGGYIEIVQFLIVEINCDVNKCDSYGSRKGRSALYMASERGHLDVVQLLLKKNADWEIDEEYLALLLRVALQNGHDKTGDILLSYIADYLQSNSY